MRVVATQRCGTDERGAMAWTAAQGATSKQAHGHVMESDSTIFSIDCALDTL